MEKTDTRGISHPTFVDNAGRKWTLALDFEVYRRVLSEHEVDLCDIVYSEQKSLRQLDSPVTLVDVLYEIVKVQAIGRGVNEIEFARSLDMSIIVDAQRKLIDEMIFFSRSHPRAAVVREVVAAADRADKRTREELERALPALVEAMEKEINFAPGVSGGGSPESSESTPASGHSGNSHGPRSSGSANDGTTPPPSLHKRPRSTEIRSAAERRSARKSSIRSRN